MATYEMRYDVVVDAIGSLYSQADKIIVADNDKRLDCYTNSKVQIVHPKEDLQDVNKFIWLFEDKIFMDAILNYDLIHMVDDDLIYPSDYANKMRLAKSLSCPVCLHGKMISEHKGRLWDYRMGSLNNSDADRFLNVPGTGCLTITEKQAMLLKRAHIPGEEVEFIGGADFFAAHLIARCELPILGIKHSEGYLKYNDLMKGKATLWNPEKIEKMARDFKANWPCGNEHSRRLFTNNYLNHA